MLKQEINLAGEVNHENILLQRLKRRGRHVAVVVLGLFALATLAVFLIFFQLNRELSANGNQISSLKNEIKKYEKTESYLVTISNRVETISSLLKTRASYTKAIANLKLILTPGFMPLSLEIGRDGSLKISGECSDNQTVSKFNDIVEILAQEGKYSKVFYPSVSRKEDGKYNLYLELKK